MPRLVPFVLVPELHNSDSSDSEEDDESLSDEQTRPAFVRKVYGIVLCQIAFTICIFSLLQYFQSLVSFINGNTYIRYSTLAALSWPGYFGFSSLESRTMAHSYPHNYIRLFIITTTISFAQGLQGFKQMNLISIMVKFVVLCCFCFDIHILHTRYYFLDSFDLTKMVPINWLLYFLAFIHLVRLNVNFSIILWFLSLICLTAMMTYWIQLILGGRKCCQHQEDYIQSALFIYMTVVYMFSNL